MASTRGTRTRPLRSETRRRVLDAAAEVFAARGIASSSVSDIAQAAGLTKGAVYSNFDSKDDLVLALMEEHVLQRLHNALAAFDAAEDVGIAVHDLGASLVDAIHADLAWQHLLFEYCGLARRDPTLRAALAERRKEGRAAVARAIERIAEARGVQLPMSAAHLAVAMLAISNGLALETGMDAEGVPDDLFPRLIALIVDWPIVTGQKAQSPARQSAAPQSSARQPPARQSAAPQSSAPQSPARQPATRRAPARESSDRRVPAGQSSARQSPARQSRARKPSAEKSPPEKPSAEKPSAEKLSGVKRSAEKPSGVKPAAEKSSAQQAPSRKPPARSMPAEKTAARTTTSRKAATPKPPAPKSATPKPSAAKSPAAKPSAVKSPAAKSATPRLATPRSAAPKSAGRKPQDSN